jgi:hypothetical protein
MTKLERFDLATVDVNHSETEDGAIGDEHNEEGASPSDDGSWQNVQP